MAVRFAADGRDYHRVVNLGTVTQFSITCWMKISVDRNTFSTAWCLDNGTTSDCYLLQADSTGTALFTFSGVTPQTLNGGDLTVGDWYFVGVSVSGGDGTAIVRKLDTSSFTATTWTGVNPSTNMVNLRLGESVFTGEWLNGCLSSVKIWTGATLTQTELEAEYPSYSPVRTGL